MCECHYAYANVCMYSCVHVCMPCMLAGVQVRRCAGAQVCRCAGAAGVQVCRCEHVCARAPRSCGERPRARTYARTSARRGAVARARLRTRIRVRRRSDLLAKCPQCLPPLEVPLGTSKTPLLGEGTPGDKYQGHQGQASLPCSPDGTRRRLRRLRRQLLLASWLSFGARLGEDLEPLGGHTASSLPSIRATPPPTLRAHPCRGTETALL